MQKNAADSALEQLRVIARIRPLLPQEQGQSLAVQASSPNSLTVAYRDEEVSVQLSSVKGPKTSQDELYSEFSSLKQQLYRGTNSAVLAYGQTGSGKTHTMFGESQDDNHGNWGLVPHSLQDVVEGLPEGGQLFMSFLQIYNDRIFDLLASQEEKLTIKEDPEAGTYVKGITEFKINSFPEGHWLLSKGEGMRVTRETAQNANSSRSHLILTLRYESACPSNGLISVSNLLFLLLYLHEAVSNSGKRGKLQLCDLAGSERVSQGMHHKEQRFKELTQINLSLSTLGKFISTY